MRKLFGNGLLLITAVSLLGGCAVYTNVPPQIGDVARHNTNSNTVKSVTLASLKAVVADAPLDEPYTVVLPVDTMPSTYEGMLPQVGPGATYNVDGSAGEGPVVRVVQIRIRGYAAEADIRRPYGGNPDTLVTAYLRFNVFGGWSVYRLRVWRPGVDSEDETGGIG